MDTIDPLSALRPSPADPFTQSKPDALGRDSFLNLLTTQMQNQDPLDPMANEDFVAQLAQFSSVEQLMGIRDSVESVYLGVAAMNNAAMAGLLGTEVMASGNGVRFDGSEQTLHWNAASDASSATLNIRDADGRVVHTEELGGISEGEGQWTWDGTGTAGTLPEGDYTFEVVASDASGDAVPVEERVHGMVDEMDYSTGVPRPKVNGVPVELGDILRLTAGE